MEPDPWGGHAKCSGDVRVGEGAAPGRSPSGATVSDPAPAIISARDVVVEFSHGRGRTLRAVDGVTFDLSAGEVLGIVGESGSGKSTLGKVLAGFLKPTAGQVLFPMAGGTLAPRERRHPRGFRDVQMIFQESAMALNPRLPVWRLVGEGVRPNLTTFSAAGRRSVADLRARVSTHLVRAGLTASAVADKHKVASDRAGPNRLALK